MYWKILISFFKLMIESLNFAISIQKLLKEVFISLYLNKTERGIILNTCKYIYWVIERVTKFCHFKPKALRVSVKQNN